MIIRREKPLYKTIRRKAEGEIDSARDLMEKVAKDFIKNRTNEDGAKKFGKKMRNLVTEDIEGNPMDENNLRNLVQEYKIKEDLFTNKCTSINLPPERQFVAEHYFSEDTQVFPNYIRNLEKVYNNLMKIFNYYLSTGRIKNTNESCHISIIRGIMNPDICLDKFGNSKNPHVYGKAIDFVFDVIDCDTIFNDIQNEKISLDKNCEVILLQDSIHLGYYDDRQSIRIENHKKEGIY